MSSIRDSVVALDTNVFLFAVRRDADYPHCEMLVFDLLPDVDVLVPGEVLRELWRNLNESLLAGVLEALRRARSVVFDHVRSWRTTSPIGRHGVRRGATQ